MLSGWVMPTPAPEFAIIEHELKGSARWVRMMGCKGKEKEGGREGEHHSKNKVPPHHQEGVRPLPTEAIPSHLVKNCIGCYKEYANLKFWYMLFSYIVESVSQVKSLTPKSDFIIFKKLIGSSGM